MTGKSFINHLVRTNGCRIRVLTSAFASADQAGDLHDVLRQPANLRRKARWTRFNRSLRLIGVEDVGAFVFQGTKTGSLRGAFRLLKAVAHEEFHIRVAAGNDVFRIQIKIRLPIRLIEACHSSAHEACVHRLTAHGKAPTARSPRRRLVVVNSLHAASKTNGMRLVVFNLLSNQANLSARVALIVKAMDDLTIKELSNRLDVFLHALVGENCSRSACDLGDLANLVEASFPLFKGSRSHKLVFL